MNAWSVVTGGSSGIGAATCKRLQRDGARVLLLDIQPPQHNAFDAFLQTDLSEPAAAAAALRAELGGRQVTRFAHCAGVCKPAFLENCDLELIQKEMAISTFALVALAQVLLPGMRAAGKGRIVAVGSRAALGKPERTGYSAAKSALTGIVRSWALELGKDGITANVVAPGATRTTMLDAHNPSDGWFMRNLESRIPVGFVADPDDIAEAIGFLASDQARFITGQVLNVCGGTSIGFDEK